MNRFSRRAVVAALFAFGSASALQAQSGAKWVDYLGRPMTLMFGGGSGGPPAPAEVAPADMARLFKTICLDTGGGTAAVGAAAIAAGLTADPLTVPAGKNSVTLNIWRGNGQVVSQTDGFFAAPNAQCSDTFYLPSVAAKQDLADAVSRAIGNAPSNAASATDKSGMPKKFYIPEWTVGGAGGTRIVSAFVDVGERDTPGSRVQIAVRDPKKAGK